MNWLLSQAVNIMPKSPSNKFLALRDKTFVRKKNVTIAIFFSEKPQFSKNNAKPLPVLILEFVGDAVLDYSRLVFSRIVTWLIEQSITVKIFR